MILASSSPFTLVWSPVTLPLLSCLVKQANHSVLSSRGMVKLGRCSQFSLYPGGHLASPLSFSSTLCWSTAILASRPLTFSQWTSSLIQMVLARLLIMDQNWSGDGLGVAVRMFCTEVGERGNPQESVVARAILATSLVMLWTWRALWSLRLRCPGKQLAVCSRDEMCIWMGKGAEDVSMEWVGLLDRSVVDIIDDPQVW